MAQSKLPNPFPTMIVTPDKLNAQVAVMNKANIVPPVAPVTAKLAAQISKLHADGIPVVSVYSVLLDKVGQISEDA
jgi:hypothetical protein